MAQERPHRKPARDGIAATLHQHFQYWMDIALIDTTRKKH